MTDRLTIYARADAAYYNASTYYRIMLPTVAMHRLGLPVSVALDHMSATTPHEARLRDATGCDIHLARQSTSTNLRSLIRDTRGWPYQYHGDKKLGPPSFVVDTDDDVFNIHPRNSSFAVLGCKDRDGNELQPGDIVMGLDAVTNDPVRLWEDGNGISFTENRARVDTWREILRLAELITVSTAGVEAAVLREIGEGAAPKLFRFPNCVDFAEYPRAELAQTNTVSILYQGSPTHWDDIRPLKDALARVLRRYPHTKMIIWGIEYDWFTRALPAEQVEIIPWLDYRAYKLRLSMLNADISLAPLDRADPFNASRSAIKFYESAATWKPSAALCQDTGPYSSEVIDRVTGLLFRTPEEFEERLCELVECAEMRRDLASNAKEWVREHRNPDTHALRYFERLSSIRRERLNWPDVVG